MKKITIILIAAFAFFQTSCAEDRFNDNEIGIDGNISADQNLCEDTDGEWREMSDCGDSCIALIQSDINCPQVLYDDCDCGPDRCWDGDFGGCIENPLDEITECQSCLNAGGTWQADTCTQNCDIQDVACYEDSCPDF